MIQDINKSHRNLGKMILYHKEIYLMALPGVLILFIFNYLPLFGTIIAFKDFTFDDGILGSKWASPIYNNFRFLFTSENTLRATRNTLLLNFSFIFFNTVCAIVLALLINEITNHRFKKLIQSVTFLPYFLSWIVVSVFVLGLFSGNYGIMNQLLTGLGMEKVEWYGSPGAWPAILTLISIWKYAGYNAVIYLATISGIDTTYYEAAQIDGATKLRQIWSITLPMLIPTIIVLTLLSIGRIMNADFGMFYGIIGDNPVLFPTTDVLDTFVYRSLRKMGDVGMSSSAALYQSAVACVLVVASNLLVRKYDKNCALF